MIADLSSRSITAGGFVLGLAMVLGCASAEPSPDPESSPRTGSVTQAVAGTCSGGQASNDFTNQCALAGGSETRCDGSGTALCCRPCRAGEGCTTACFDRTEDAELAPDKFSRPPHVLYTYYGAGAVKGMDRVEP